MTVNDPKLPKDEIDDDAQGLSLLDDDEIADMNDDSLVDDDVSFNGEDDATDDGDDDDGDGAGGDGDDDDAAAAAQDADGTGAAEDAAKAGAGGDDVAAADAAAAAAAGEEGKTPAAGEGADGGPAPVTAPAKPYVAPAAAEHRIAEIDKAIDDLDAKYDDGDLSRAEYRAEERKLRDQREDLVYQKRSTEDRIDTFTTATVPAFLSTNTEYKPGSLRYQMLDIAVRKVQDEMIRTKSGDPLSVDALQKAHDMVVAELGGGTSAPKPAAKPKPVLPARPAMPPSLGTLPSANIESTATDRFAAIDRLKGEAQEEAIARMSEADQEAYLAWQG